VALAGNALVIGLTGGVASGKSTVARAFAALNPGCVVDADEAARAVVAPGSEGLAAVVGAFGPGVLEISGELDRAGLRQRVFNDPSARQQLEALLHPRIRAWMRERAKAAGAAPAGRPYVLLDIPLLAESGGRKAWGGITRVLVVDAPPELQRQRLLARDGIDAALAERMLAAQASRAQRLAIADDVLVNAGTLAALKEAVQRLDARYRALSGIGQR